MFLVNREDAADLDLVLLNNKGSNGFVVLFTSSTGPGHRILESSDLQRTEKGDLLLERDRDGEADEDSQHCNADRFHHQIKI